MSFTEGYFQYQWIAPNELLVASHISGFIEKSISTKQINKSLYIYLTINYYCFHFCIYHDQTIDNPMEESLNFLLIFASVSSRLPYINFAEYHNGTKLHILTVSITQFENNKQNKNANILNFKLKCAYIFISSFFRLYLFSKTLLVVARSKVQNRVSV